MDDKPQETRRFDEEDADEAKKDIDTKRFDSDESTAQEAEPPPAGGTVILGDDAPPGIPPAGGTVILGDDAPPSTPPAGGTVVFGTQDAATGKLGGEPGSDGEIAVYKSLLPDRLRIVFPDRSEVVFNSYHPYLVIGRRTTTNKGTVDVDLSPMDAGVNGVSRMHAMIVPNERGLVLKDLNSTNGTFLNGQKLTPQLTYPIKSGDYVKVGNLKMQIHFVFKQ